MQTTLTVVNYLPVILIIKCECKGDHRDAFNSYRFVKKKDGPKFQKVLMFVVYYKKAQKGNDT